MITQAHCGPTCLEGLWPPDHAEDVIWRRQIGSAPPLGDANPRTAPRARNGPEQRESPALLRIAHQDLVRDEEEHHKAATPHHVRHGARKGPIIGACAGKIAQPPAQGMAECRQSPMSRIPVTRDGARGALRFMSLTGPHSSPRIRPRFPQEVLAGAIAAPAKGGSERRLPAIAAIDRREGSARPMVRMARARPQGREKGAITPAGPPAQRPRAVHWPGREDAQFRRAKAGPSVGHDARGCRVGAGVSDPASRLAA